VNVILYKPLGEFHQIFNVGAVGDKYELTRSQGQKVKGQGDK